MIDNLTRAIVDDVMPDFDLTDEQLRAVNGIGNRHAALVEEAISGHLTLVENGLRRLRVILAIASGIATAVAVVVVFFTIVRVAAYLV